QPVTLLCVVRNIGQASLPANHLRLRCFAMSGLEYTAGDTQPVLPGLEPQQAVAYRWRLLPSDMQGIMAAAVLLERTDPHVRRPAGDASAMRVLTGQAAITVIPRLTTVPGSRSVSVAPDGEPRAIGRGRDACIYNDRIQLRFLAGDSMQTPLLLLALRERAGWRTVAHALPLLEVLSGEEGQIPWWEAFRWRDALTTREKAVSRLLLKGTMGSRWRVEIHLELRAGTSAIDGHVHLMAARPVRLHCVRLPRLFRATEISGIKADGSATPVPLKPATVSAEVRASTVELPDLSYGLTWAATPPLPEWSWRASPLGDFVPCPVLWGECYGPPAGTALAPAQSIRIPFRLFVARSVAGKAPDITRFLIP
ncbi:MAG: hypothetical protein NZ557_11850, partial [Chthonomonadaceae bacterium]|nr:hypothetical protein [Chthonomonadaceae bacterium]